MNYFEKKQWIRLGICVVVLIAVSLFLTGIIGGKNLTYQLPENVEETKAVELPQGENVKTATAKGFASDVTVAVTMEGEKITALTVDDSGESYPVAREDSVEKVIAAIIEANGTEGVDVNTGATFTCTAIVNAVNEILAPDAGAVKEVALTPGTYEAEAQGLLSTVKVKVSVSEKEITDLEIDASGETDTLGGIAAEKLTAKILEAQTPNVDTISGATVTSNAVIKAVTEALKAAGADIAALDANRRDQGGEDKAREEKIIDTEIVIIGAGGAGMTAAIMTKQAGKDFVLLEKMPYAGGNTTKATGGMNAAETHYQKEQGIEDSVELFAADTIKGGHDLNDPELVGVMAKESAGAIDWLDSIGAELPKISFSGGASVNRIHAPADGSGVGEYLVEKFSAKLEELGVEIMYETKATELLTDADGKICGVKAEGADCDYVFNCKAVILATGGFGANEEMYTQYRPDLKGTVTTNAPGATGDGIVMAQALGADLVDIEQIQLHPTVEQTTSMLITESVRGDGAILVNQSGVRFTNELLTRDAVSAAELAQEGCYAYIIFDQNLRDHLKAVEKYVKTGITVQADTIEGLAEQLGIDPAVLAKTLTDWNEYVKNQNDPDFGRTTGMEADLTTPPYYAIKIAPGIHHTMGGVKIDTSAHVINTEGKAIPGLYAAGEVTGGVHGGNRLGGNAVADIVIFGRISAATAIAELEGANEPETASGQTTETAGTVTGTATVKGYGGDVTVTVTLENGKIIAVEMTGDGETNGIGHRIIDEWPQVFVENDGILDTYTGATFAGITRQAVIEATRNALTDAGVNPDDYLREETAEGEAAELIIEADIVIAGAGGAGMTAALTAADAGKSVLVLESQPAVGGNSVKSTGGMNASKTVFQDKNEFGESAGIEKTLAAAENYADNEAITALAATVKEQWEAWQAAPEGYFDSPELFALDTLIGGKGLNDPELVNTLVNNSAAAIDWLSTVGIDLNNVAAFGGASVKRIHRPVNDEGKVVSVGAYTIPRLEQACAERNNLALMTDVTVTRILTDDSGAVCGVEALGKNGNLITVNAKAVIIATGGFGANLEMVASYAPQLEGFMTTNAAGIQGQGILMAAELGAATVDMDQIQIHPTVQADTASLITEGLRGDGAILINANGERFIDEVGTRDVVSAAEIAQPGSFSWLVVDQKMVDASSVIQGYISRGLMISGETYEELADNLGIPADTFAATMAAWNGYVADKNDPDFGRTSFASPLDTAPYYAVKVTAGIHHTMGGLKIDTETHVLKENGEIIPGLYAAGEVTGGVHGANRLGGNAVADFVVFGRIAGETAVKELSGTAEPEPASEPETTETVTTDSDTTETEQNAAQASPSVIRQVMVTMGNNSENNIVIDYLEQDPYLVNIYEGFGFAKDYGSARGHTYTLEDVSKTQRPHPKANCITCKTDDFAKMVNTEGISVYSMPFDDVIGQMNNTVSCYTCHGDGMGADGQVTVTHSYVNTALGEAAGDIPAAILACGQCHIEYYFTPSDSETMMPYHSKAEMIPEAILAYYDGMGFYDWEQPGTGTKMLKAQHPETETVLNSGHFAKTGMTCADCHMPVQTTEDGIDYKSHTFISPIQSETLLDTCAKCHGGAEAVISLVQNTQAKVTARETEVGNKLSTLKDALTAAVAEGKLSDEELDALRKLHREAQWYFDFCYVENSEGAHNSKLSLSCLDTSESKIDEAMAMITPAE